MPLDEQEEPKYERIVAREPEYREIAEMITVYEKRGRTTGKREGRKEGRREGRREGLVEGKQATLARLLEKKFGKLQDAIVLRIHELRSPAELDALSEAVLDAQSLDDLDL